MTLTNQELQKALGEKIAFVKSLREETDKKYDVAQSRVEGLEGYRKLLDSVIIQLTSAHFVLTRRARAWCV